ncbi:MULTISPECIES: YggS family pyridoxal phosphate-dependent enzyme [unclassified Oceanobacillus]|uniref:YggS family pyridoxal phosphate-dependent enzyme n=1 Tax=unclassified Oceanobacillus TaxID=2630292 RepID=UPI001BE50514|nr:MULTISPECIES: YggS family pyridoxal phosphate-dependent enzyme [unclassified Oceanobacillus]MBT2598788.1 YggS family pyridoxal phosphate-dependent enzyme [Oceanobacillus sp. ISL-74]MBT2651707.1 YggS family pyridoxal phosphate-dependent enzyme [Oceanobacillus sp. ISL-73]
MVDVATNLSNIEENIRQACENVNRDPEDIHLIAVTKYVTIERTKEAINAGINNLGENRNEGFLEKYNEIQNQVQWHFIGSLQSRKVKDIINQVDFIHSLDRLSLAKEINKRAVHPVNCFIQVNVSGEESKHGISPEEVITFIEQLSIYENIKVVGLMTMAPHVDDPENVRPVFKKLKNLRDDVTKKSLPHAPCKWLSMGMSNDYHIAIEEGATHVRIGSKLVG